MVTIQQDFMLDTCKNILEKYITLSFNYSVKHMMNLTLLTFVLLSFYYSGAHIWYILWLKIPRITSDVQNDASTYWTFPCGILSSLPISSMRELFVLIPLSKTNYSMKYLLFHKVENFQLPRLDLILSPSSSMKIQIVSGKITENLGFESPLWKVKWFLSFFLFIFKFFTHGMIGVS